MVPAEVYTCMIQCVQSSELEIQKQVKTIEVLITPISPFCIFFKHNPSQRSNQATRSYDITPCSYNRV